MPKSNRGELWTNLMLQQVIVWPITMRVRQGEFKHEVRQFEKSYDNQQAEPISLMV